MVTILFKTVREGGYTGKIEETVIGQIDDGGFIGSSPVFDDQSIGLILQAISHFYFEIYGEASSPSADV